MSPDSRGERGTPRSSEATDAAEVPSERRRRTPGRPQCVTWSERLAAITFFAVPREARHRVFTL
jgi:hypothetical protein